MVSRNAVVIRKITRATEEPVKYRISNFLFLLLTFGASQASRGYFMSDEVGWHLNHIQKISRNYAESRGTVDYLQRLTIKNSQ